jgi:hypothetical protein
MNEGLANFGAYQKSRELFEHVLVTHPLCRRRWLPSERVAPRVALCEEIIRILSATIVRLTPHE